MIAFYPIVAEESYKQINYMNIYNRWENWSILN